MTGENGRVGDTHPSSSHDAKALLGRVVGGKYRVERILGQGGMGTIYVAEQQPLGRKVALKILHPSLAGGGESDPEFAKRFLLEAATLSQLAHPNIVVVHDYGSLEDAEAVCFMVMELIEGRTINEVLREERVLAPARALRIARDIARALRAAHHLGVVHRDLKPSNVMLRSGPEGEVVKVLDFGLVKVMRDDIEELTAEGRFLGSPRYMSPEQIQKLPMDGRSDLYSLGVILYRMLCGEVPFAGDQALQTLMSHLTKPVPLMSEVSDVPVSPAIEQIVRKLLEKDPNARYADASELIRAIDAVWAQIGEEPLFVSGEHARPHDVRGSGEFTPTSGSLPSLSFTSVPAVVGAAPPPASGAAPAAPVAQVTTLPAPAEAPRGSRRWLFPVVVILGVAVGIGLATVVGGLFDVEEDPGPSTAEAPREVDAPAPEPEVAAPEPPLDRPIEDPGGPAPRRFTLTVRSLPEGATLLRDGVEVGTTPATVELDPDALRAAPARFELRMRGRETVAFEQGPSASNVDVERVLPILTRRPPRPPRPPTETDPTPPPRGGDNSIKTRR